MPMKTLEDKIREKVAKGLTMLSMTEIQLNEFDVTLLLDGEKVMVRGNDVDTFSAGYVQ